MGSGEPDRLLPSLFLYVRTLALGLIGKSVPDQGAAALPGASAASATVGVAKIGPGPR